jgi:hypothetical protein
MSPGDQISDQISELVDQARAADRREQQRQAAFFYEQARRHAIDSGQVARAFSIGARTARSWGIAGDYRRELTILLELLYDIPDTADPWDVYLTKQQYLWYLLGSKSDPDLDQITACAHELDSLCASLGEPDSRDIPYRAAIILSEQGKYAEALTQYEIAWSRQVAGSIYLGEIASRAAIMALSLDQRTEAQRWLNHISSDYWADDARVRSAYTRLLIALYDNSMREARAALLGADDAMRGVERPRYTAELTDIAMAALLLDQRFGDPLGASHPAGQRLAEFPDSELSIPARTYYWHISTIILQLAGLRYAAGITPVDDVYYRKPHRLRSSSAARLPSDLRRRADVAWQACDNAKPVVAQLDRSFRCSWRQERIEAFRSRIDEIATAHKL